MSTLYHYNNRFRQVNTNTKQPLELSEFERGRIMGQFDGGHGAESQKNFGLHFLQLIE